MTNLKDTIMRDLKSRMNLKKEDDEDQEDQAKPKIVNLPEDALLEAQLRPLSKKEIVVRFLVRSPQLSMIFPLS